MKMNARTLKLLAVVALLLIAPIAPVMAASAPLGGAYEGKVSKVTQESVNTGLGGMFAARPVDDAVITYGAEQQPGFFVTLDEDTEDAFGTLDSWANSSSKRTIIEHRAGSNRALVAAPAAHVVGGVLRSGLKSKAYVDRIDINRRLSYAEPLNTLAEDSQHSVPAPPLLVEGAWPAEGVAYAEDANQTTPAEVRDIIGLDNMSQTGDGVRVAVLDTGVNTDEGTLYGNGTRGSTIRIDAARNFVTGQNATASNEFENVSDGNGHGSWVASAVAANTSNATFDGAAPDATLLVGKTLNDDGQGSTEQIADGIDWARRQDADVISMSLGSAVYSPTIAQEIDEFLADGGTAVVVASGNGRMNPATRYISSPADTPVDGVIAVGATNGEPAPNASSAYFSEVGPDAAADFSGGVTAGQGPNVAAPGMETVTMVADESGYQTKRTLSGTSMSTPYVAGGIAVVLEANPSWENESAYVSGYAQNTSRAMPMAGVTEAGGGMFAADALASSTVQEMSQSEARTVAAKERDAANRGFSSSWFARRWAQYSRTLSGFGEVLS